jgi:carbonic anhydrase
VTATLEQLRRPASGQSKNLKSIVDLISPAVRDLVNPDGTPYDESMVSRAVRANVRASADHLRHGSPVLEQLIQTSGLLVVGAEYSLETGVVDFFDGVPGASR